MIYSIEFLLRNSNDDLLFQVEQKYSDRLQERLEANRDFSDDEGFFVFRTTDGRHIAVNLSEVQGFRFLEDIATTDSIDLADPGPIKIHLRDRRKPLEEFTDFDEDIFDLFTDLEHGPAVVEFPSFRDEDAEVIQLRARDIVWISAPGEILESGRQIVARQDGLPLDE